MDLDFVIDTRASEDNEEFKSFTNTFPVITNTKLTLGIDSKAESEDEASDDDEDYFGKIY